MHEVEIIEKLSDVFSRTFQQGTSESSKSIIADLVNKYNHNSNNYVPQNGEKITSNQHIGRVLTRQNYNDK